MARPKKEITRQRTITVHCSYTEYLVLKKYAELTGLPMSQYLRTIGLEKEIKPILSEEEVLIFRNFVNIGNNLNQVAKHLNEGNQPDESVGEILVQFQTLLNKFYDR
jgi:hypothetical protein